MELSNTATGVLPFDALADRREYVERNYARLRAWLLKLRLYGMKLPFVVYKFDEDEKLKYLSEPVAGLIPDRAPGTPLTDVLDAPVYAQLKAAMEKAMANPGKKVEWYYRAVTIKGPAVFYDQLVYIDGEFTNVGILYDVG